jgi:hypothetical protein
MSTWRQFAEQVKRGDVVGDKRDNRDISPDLSPSVPSVSNVPLDPVRLTRLWKAGLESIDPRQPMHGLSQQRWRTLCDDAVFLFGGFGQQAARDCWATADLFGLWPDKDA